MSWIEVVAEQDAQGTLAEIYAETREKHGRVLQLVLVQSLRPEAMAIGRSLYRELMDGPGALSRLQRVLIATVVSRLNGCFY